jgi:hypothetical protein
MQNPQNSDNPDLSRRTRDETDEWLKLIIPALRNAYEQGYLYSICIENPGHSSLHFRGPNDSIEDRQNKLIQARLLERFARRLREELKW